MHAVVYIVLGLALAVAGAWLIRSSKYKYGDLSFFRAWTPRSLSFYGGAIALLLGLWLLVIGVRAGRWMP